MTTKPGVVLVHGAWHTPWHFENVMAELEEKGYEVEAPALPTVGTKAVDNALSKAVAVVKQAIYKITSQGKDVVIVMHSFGGVIGSEAVGEVQEEMKKSSSEHGRIIHLLYIAAIIIGKGTCWAQQNDCSEAHVTEVRDGMIHHLEPMKRFYNTMDPDLAEKCAARLQAQSLGSFLSPMAYEGYGAEYGIPITYVACERDMALNIDTAQLMFIRRIEGAGGKVSKVERLDCDHTPWLNGNRSEFFDILWDVLKRASSEGS